MVAGELPEVRVSPWLGQEVKGILDLDDPPPGACLDGAPTWSLGFDGVHYNFEPVNNGDPELLDLLHTRAPSAAGRSPPPPPRSNRSPSPAASSARRRPRQVLVTRLLPPGRGPTDQVAIMTYDTYLPFRGPTAVTSYGRARWRWSSPPDDKTILIGAPAYHDHGLSWLDEAESVEGAAQGARLALTSHGVPRERFGLALYVDFAATEEDWEEYDRFWSHP